MVKSGCENCDNCALCCKGWDIELSKEDIRSLAALGYILGDFLETKPQPRMKAVGKERDCIFLDKESRCVLEKRHGHSAKPHTCRHYPRMNAERIKEKDYYFYEYAGRTLSRDVLVKMLERLKNAGEDELFEVLLFQLEKLRKHRGSYIDAFNYDDRRRHSELSKAFAARRLKKLARSRVRGDDTVDFGKIAMRRKFDTARFIETLQEKLRKGEGINPNLPDMLLAYLFAIKNAEPRDAKALAAYFFEWNAKRF